MEEQIIQRINQGLVEIKNIHEKPISDFPLESDNNPASKRPIDLLQPQSLMWLHVP